MIHNQISFLPSDTDVNVTFPRWVTQHCNDTSTVLDVGAGKGQTGDAAYIQQNVGHLVGVDPDIAINENPYLDERYHSSIEDFAKNHTSRFDCLYARFVLEHITHPTAFFASCKSLLKPGGMLFGVTPNLWHYFGMATKLSASLGIEEWLLDRIVGAQAKASYHFPTRYRINSTQKLKRVAEQTGFREIEFVCFDSPRSYNYCFSQHLRWFPRFYSRFVYTIKQPKIMGSIMFRAII